MCLEPWNDELIFGRRRDCSTCPRSNVILSHLKKTSLDLIALDVFQPVFKVLFMGNVVENEVCLQLQRPWKKWFTWNLGYWYFSCLWICQSWYLPEPTQGSEIVGIGLPQILTLDSVLLLSLHEASRWWKIRVFLKKKYIGNNHVHAV